MRVYFAGLGPPRLVVAAVYRPAPAVRYLLDDFALAIALTPGETNRPVVAERLTTRRAAATCDGLTRTVFATPTLLYVVDDLYSIDVGPITVLVGRSLNGGEGHRVDEPLVLLLEQLGHGERR